MLKFSLIQIKDIANGQLINNNVENISLILTDSRNLDIHNAANTIFFAIKGFQNDGHRFIDSLYKSGVRAFVISEEVLYDNFPDAGFIKVNNCITSLQKIAGHKRSQFDIPIIGITGSNGKTIVKEWLFHLLMDKNKVVRSPQSYNSQIGVPLSLWLLDKKSEIGIFEAGISMSGEMDLLQKIILPKIGILTNIGEAHQQNFSSLSQKVAEKIKLFKNCEKIIFPSDNKTISEEIQNIDNSIERISWSKNNNGIVNILNIEKTHNGSVVDLLYNNCKYKYSIPFTDNGSVENSITCFCALIALNIIPNQKILSRFSSLPAIEMRLQILEGVNNSTIINDSYNSDINSLKIALEYLNHKKGNKKTVVILSDVLQNYENEEKLYSEVSELIKSKKISKFIGVGEALSRNKNKFEKDSEFYLTTHSLIERIKYKDISDSCILLKGARSFEFEKICNKLQQQSHETYIEVNLNSIKHNFDFFKKKLGRNVKTMAVVKAFSYGSGYQEIALFLEHNRVDYLAVAYVDEGVELRKHGIKAPIMVMNPAKDAIPLMIEFKLEPEIYSISLLKYFSEFLEKSTLKSFPIHIKLDTGMHRLGLSNNKISEAKQIIEKSEKLQIISIFSHLVGSDNPKFDNKTKEQVKLFDSMFEELSNNLPTKPLKHILNSAGAIRFPEFSYDMVRLGIGLYGVTPQLSAELIQVSTFKTKISQIHHINKGDSVSYNASGKIIEDTITATLPVGYADGLDRKLGNSNWEVIVNNRKTKIIGDICMDMCIINLNGIDAKEGDEVIIFGKENPVSKMAEICNTIPYEIITRLSERVKRIYVHE